MKYSELKKEDQGLLVGAILWTILIVVLLIFG
jgi:hypothetical protein